MILLIAGMILASAAFVDGLSTVHFLRKGLDEQNPLFGKYPSKFRLFGEGAAIISVEIAAVALVGHYAHTVGMIGSAALLIQATMHAERAHYNFGL